MKDNKKFLATLFGVSIACFALTACGGTTQDSQPESEAPKLNPPTYTVDESYPTSKLKPNHARFALTNIEQKPNSPLKGKTIYWLGSSVTYGFAAEGLSMADYLQARTCCVSVKEAVSGTTLAETGDNKSYTSRMEKGSNFVSTAKIDAFICQVSTNNAKSENLDKWGELTAVGVTDRNEFDKATSIGGIEYIISYVHDTWNCPIYFYSGARFGDEGLRSNSDPSGTNYGRFVEEAQKAIDKWNAIEGYTVEMIDLFNDDEFNELPSDTYYKWSMKDAIHPCKASYLQWWTPYFDDFLCARLSK